MFNALSSEGMKLLEEHRKSFHSKDKKDCIICRSLRRTILKGFSL